MVGDVVWVALEDMANVQAGDIVLPLAVGKTFRESNDLVFNDCGIAQRIPIETLRCFGRRCAQEWHHCMGAACYC